MQSNLPNTPSSIVARAYKLDLGFRHNLLNELGHDLRNNRAQDLEAQDGHVSHECVAGLADWGVRMLWGGPM